MKKQKGITLVALTITIVVMIIIASITTYAGIDLIKEAKLQDLVTNMLLIQAKAKECVEEVKFQKLAIESDEAQTYLIGNKLSGSEAETEAKEVISEINDGNIKNYYYLSEGNLNNIGLKDLSIDDYGYFIIKYDIENITAEVMNTKGYKGNYTLKDLQALQGD